VDHGRPRSTVDRCPCKAIELARAQHVAALELKGTGQGGRQGQGIRSGLYQRLSGGEAVRWWLGLSVEARFGAGDEERRASEGLVRCGVLRGSSGRLLQGPEWRGAAGGGRETTSDGGELQRLWPFWH
jgi:hypothetical protein